MRKGTIKISLPEFVREIFKSAQQERKAAIILGQKIMKSAQIGFC